MKKKLKVVISELNATRNQQTRLYQYMTLDDLTSINAAGTGRINKK